MAKTKIQNCDELFNINSELLILALLLEEKMELQIINFELIRSRWPLIVILENSSKIKVEFRDKLNVPLIIRLLGLKNLKWINSLIFNQYKHCFIIINNLN